MNNLYSKRLNCDQDEIVKEFQHEIVARMLQSKIIENTLAADAEKSDWSRRKSQFTSVSFQDVQDFPQLTEKDLIVYGRFHVTFSLR